MLYQTFPFHGALSSGITALDPPRASFPNQDLDVHELPMTKGPNPTLKISVFLGCNSDKKTKRL